MPPPYAILPLSHLERECYKTGPMPGDQPGLRVAVLPTIHFHPAQPSPGHQGTHHQEPRPLYPPHTFSSMDSQISDP